MLEIINVSVALISLIGYLFLAFISIKSERDKFFFPFILYVFSLTIWSLGFLFLTLNVKPSMMFWITVQLCGLVAYPATLLHFNLIYTNANKIKSKLVASYSLMTIFLILNIKGYFIKSVSFNERSEMIYSTNWGLVVFAIISLMMIIYGLLHLIRFGAKSNNAWKSVSMMVYGNLLVSVASFLCVIPFFGRIPIDFISGFINAFCIAFAIFKLNFLNIVRIALQNVVDQISDSYIIVNDNLEIIDYNKTFTDTFSRTFSIKRKENVVSMLESGKLLSNIDTDKLRVYINESITEQKTVSFEKQIISGEFDKYFDIEVTPIIKNDNHLGTIILLKDITQHKKDMELIQQAQNQLVQRERLATLGELAGGVAHDINSPLSAVQGGLSFTSGLFVKYFNYLKDESITPEKLKETEEKIFYQIKNSANACEKIVKIVNSIRNNTRNLSGEDIQEFYVADLIDDLKTMLNHQLKQAVCELVLTEERRSKIIGDPGKLGQVLTNLIVNAMQAYDGKPGKIEVTIGEKENKIIIKVVDYAGGIPAELKDSIFKEMLTTKGTQGTGLGLYLSNSIITGHFGGKVSFESEEGKGTAFYIELPLNKIKQNI